MPTAVPTTPTLFHAWRDASFTYLSHSNFLYGSADPGTVVQLWNDGTLLLTVSAWPDGTWHTDGTPLPDGSYHISVVSVNPEGIKSAASPVDNFLVDNNAPAAPTIALDDPGMRDSAPARFSGSAEAGAIIDLRFGQAGSVSAVTNAGGHWSASAVVADGHYSIVATARDAAGNTSPVSSALDFVRTTPDDFGNDAAGAGALAIGGATSATIDYTGDIDWFKVSLDTLTSYNFSLKGAQSGGGTLPSPTGAYPTAALQLWDPQGNDGKGKFLYMNNIGAFGADVLMAIPIVRSGDYFLVASAVNVKGSYKVGAVATSHDDYYGDQAHAATIAVGGAITGSFNQGGDVDTFKVMLTAGTTYVFELDPGAGLVSPDSLVIELTDAAGSIRISNTMNSAQQAIVSFAPTSSGAHFLSVSYSYYNSVGNYLLKALTAPDDFGASTVDSGALAIGATVHGTVEVSGDHDWFAVQLQANTAYTFALDEGDRGNAALFYLHDATGARLNVNVQHFDHGRLLTWTPSASGTYFLDVGNTNGNTPYTLQARFGDIDDHGASPATAGNIFLGQGTAGRLEAPGDVDWYKVSFKANSAYIFSMQPTHEGLSSFVNGGSLAVVDAFGRVQASGRQNNGATQLTYQPEADGDYYVAVSAYNQVFSYMISTSVSDQDRYLANDGTTGTLSPGGLLKSSIDFSGDADWVRVELQAGQHYWFELTGAHGKGGTLATPELKLYDSSGRALSSSLYGGTGNDPQLSISPSESGTYYVQAGATGNGTGSYTLKEASATVALADTTPPQVYSLRGPSYAGDDPQTANIRVFLSEAVTPGSGIIALRLASGELVETFDVATSTRLSFSATGALTIDPSVALAYGTHYRIDIDAIAVKDQVGLTLETAYSGSFLTIERSLNVVGGPGNDSYISTSDADVIDGGAGIDTVRYHGNASAYAVRLGNAHTQQVFGTGAIDSLLNVERIVFDDRALAYDSDGSAGQAYRLYQASFNRTPDATGLGFWMAQMDKGASLHAVAQAFVASAEFKTLFGAAPTDDAFVTALYSNLLHRAPDQGGHDFWADVLQHGGARADVLAAFSESTENQVAVIGQIGQGIDYIPYG